MAQLNMSQVEAAEVAAQLVAVGFAFSYQCTGEQGSAIAHRITIDDSRAALLAHCLQIAKERLGRGRN